MPLKLNVGVSRKIGLPEYSSAGASCNIELELEAGLLQRDPGAFHAEVCAAFTAAEQAVDDELARIRAQLAAAPRAGSRAAHRSHEESPHADGLPRRLASQGRITVVGERGARPCTAKQIRAIRAIARGLDLSLEQLLRDEYHVAQPDQLTLDQASRLIESLNHVGAR